jgi:hypothetical protein
LTPPFFGWTIPLIGFLKKNSIISAGVIKVQETKLITSRASDVTDFSKQVLKKLVEM